MEIRPDPPTRSLTTAPAPWGPFGAGSAMGDAHTRLGRCNKEEKKERSAPGLGSGSLILCPVPQARRTLQELQSSREARSPQHQCSCLPCGHPSGPGNNLFRKAKYKAGFLERPERRRSFRTRPSRHDLTPPAPGYGRTRKFSFHFRGEGAVGKRPGRRAEAGVVPCGMTGSVVFSCSTVPVSHARLLAL